MKKNFSRVLTVAGVLGCCLLFSIGTASAAVTGTLATGSSGGVSATITSITFSSDPAALGGTNFACPAGGICDADVSTATSGSLKFAGCASGILGSSPGCLSAAEGIDVNSPITASSIGESNFLTFSNNSNLVYSLLGIATYTNASCTGLSVGESCVVYPGAALQLTLEAGNTTQVTLSVNGKASDSGVAGLASGSNYNGGFTELLTGPLPNGMAPTPANIQFFFCGTNSVTSIAQCNPNVTLTETSNSGNFTASAVPEPSSVEMTVMGIGLILAGALARRFRHS